MTTDTTEADIREFVHERYRRTDDKLDRILSEVKIVGLRLTSMEARLTSLDHSVAHVHERIDGIQGQLNGVSDRLDRIARRLDIADDGETGKA